MNFGDNENLLPCTLSCTASPSCSSSYAWAESIILIKKTSIRYWVGYGEFLWFTKWRSNPFFKPRLESLLSIAIVSRKLYFLNHFNSLENKSKVLKSQVAHNWPPIVERGTKWVKCLAQQHNSMPGLAWTWIFQVGMNPEYLTLIGW